MKFSSFVERIGGEGAAAWNIHTRAVERLHRGDDVILLSIGDPDFDTPAPITDAAIASLRAGNTHYTSVVGEPELRQAIAAQHRRNTGQEVGPEQVVVLAGAQCGLFSAALCILEPGDEIIVPEPMYVTYEAVIGATGARLVTVPLRPERQFHLDPGDLAAAVTDRTRAVLLNAPHNPTGAILTRDAVEAVAEVCIRHDLWLISDEVYAALAYDRPFVSPCGLPGMGERTVTVNSLSKSHAMTGWRIGWAVTPPEMVEHMANLALCMLYGCPGFVQDAAVVALEGELREVATMRDAYRARRDLVCERLSGVPGLRCQRPEGGMFVMLDIRGTGQSAYGFSDGLLDVAGISVLAGDAFGPSAAGHVRLSLGVSEETLRKACDRIVDYVVAGGSHRS